LNFAYTHHYLSGKSEPSPANLVSAQDIVTPIIIPSTKVQNGDVSPIHDKAADWIISAKESYPSNTYINVNKNPITAPVIHHFILKSKSGCLSNCPIKPIIIPINMNIIKVPKPKKLHKGNPNIGNNEIINIPTAKPITPPMTILPATECNLNIFFILF
jgi:hypothetical protein